VALVAAVLEINLPQVEQEIRHLQFLVRVTLVVAEMGLVQVVVVGRRLLVVLEEVPMAATAAMVLRHLSLV
jgi:hypothetical protein